MIAEQAGIRAMHTHPIDEEAAWSWDITYLATNVKGPFIYRYLASLDCLPISQWSYRMAETEGLIMAHSTMLHVRVDDEIKTQSSEALAAIGLSVSDAVRILLKPYTGALDLFDKPYARRFTVYQPGRPVTARTSARRWSTVESCSIMKCQD